jgi:exodeoxyribonuclease III
VKIATWNVNGVRAREGELQAFIAQEQPDILCLQEIKASVEQLPMWLCDIPGYACHWHGAKGYSGVALHVRAATVSERPEFSHPTFDFENRIVAARLATVTVASIYVPNGGKDFPAKMRFLEALEQYAAEHALAGRPLIVCGDMNVALTDMDVHPKLRTPNGIGQRPDERALMARIIDHGLVDVHRQLEPDNAALFTWWAPWRNMRQRNIGWRLDLILASRIIAERVTSCVVLREFGASDHGPVIAVFDDRAFDTSAL